MDTFTIDLVVPDPCDPPSSINPVPFENQRYTLTDVNQSYTHPDFEVIYLYWQFAQFICLAYFLFHNNPYSYLYFIGRSQLLSNWVFLSTDILWSQWSSGHCNHSDWSNFAVLLGSRQDTTRSNANCDSHGDQYFNLCNSEYSDCQPILDVWSRFRWSMHRW